MLDLRTYDGELQDKYQGEDFDYSLQDGQAQNLIERFLQWFFQTLRDNFGIDISPEAIQLFEYFIYILMGGLVIYLLVRFLIGENISGLFKKNPPGIVDISLSEEQLEQIDLDALLKTALSNKDYRLAIRYQYLRSLKVLSRHSIIDWHFEKTNWDYIREINAPALKLIFKEVSYLYDYIWYGEQAVNEEIYRAAQARFEALHNQIPR